MRTSTQPAGQDSLARFASAISARVDQHLVAVEEAAAARLRSEAAKRGARTRAENAKQAREAPLTAARLELARAGLERLLEFGPSKSIENILDALDRLHHHSRGQLFLYRVSRLSGGAWEDPKYSGPAGSRDVMIAFGRQHLWIAYGAGAIGQMTKMKFPYIKMGNASYEEDVAKLFEDIAGPYAADLKLAGNRLQRCYEWKPEDVLFQFLVNCADKSCFSRYLTRAANRLERSIKENLVLY